MKSQHLKKAVIIPIAVIVLVFLAVLVGTPYLIDIGIERWIASQGPEIAQVDNIDFNPFTGSMIMDNLVVETTSGRTVNIARADLKFSWKQLFKKHLYFKEIVIRDVYMLVDHLGEKGFRVGGLIIQELAGAGEKSDTPGWEVGIGSFVLQNAQIKYDTPELNATYHIDNYSLTGLETWNKQKPVKMAFQGRINESPVQVDAEVLPFAAVKTWKGSLNLKGGDLELVSKMQGLQEYELSGTVDFDLDLDAERQGNGAISLDAAGSVVLNNLHLLYGQYSLLQERFSWQGRAAVRQQEPDLWLEMAAELNGDSLGITDKVSDTALVGLAGYTVTGISIAGLNDIRADLADLQGLHLVEARNGTEKEAKEKKDPLLKIAKVTISSISLQNKNDSSIGEVRIQDLTGLIHRDKKGNWQFAAAETKSEAAADEAAAVEKVAKEPAKQPLQFELGSLQISGDSSISFKDESLPRPFQTVFHIDEFNLGNTKIPGTGEPTKFQMKGRVGDYGSVAFEGNTTPSEQIQTIDTTGTINALDMVPFSSYTGKAIGYNVTSGQLDADITMKIDKGIMDGLFDLHMRNLEVAQVDPEKEPEVDKQMDVPLGSALSMLRNKKDEINLKLELKGDIKSPGFGIQDAINQALAKAMKFATLSYLKYTLQPFGTYIAIAEVVGKAGKEISKVELDPVVFPAGATVIDETGRQYLGKIKELLDNRPKIRIELCGRATEQDRVAQAEQLLAKQQEEKAKSGGKPAAAAIEVPDEKLLELAGARAKMIKDALIDQHGIDHERIYICLPALVDDPAKEPMVELFLD